MKVYVDTSALVKLYVEEEGSEFVRQAYRRATLIPISGLAYVEARAAFSRALHEKRLRPADYRNILSAFLRDWDSYFVLEVTSTLIGVAGELTESLHLRAFDAIHLASALSVQEALDESIHFLCFDHRLNQAARTKGLTLL